MRGDPAHPVPCLDRTEITSWILGVSREPRSPGRLTHSSAHLWFAPALPAVVPGSLSSRVSLWGCGKQRDAAGPMDTAMLQSSSLASPRLAGSCWPLAWMLTDSPMLSRYVFQGPKVLCAGHAMMETVVPSFNFAEDLNQIQFFLFYFAFHFFPLVKRNSFSFECIWGHRMICAFL